MSGRTVFVGDVHGCREELDALLAAVRFSTGDRLVLAGDLVARGPDSRGVLRLVRTLGARAVRGNHEERLLRWHRARGTKEKIPLGPNHLDLARQLGAEEWALLDGLPLWLDLPEHGVRVLHAGVDPALPFCEQDRETILHVRMVGQPKVLWASRYQGPEHIVFGHHAMVGLQFHPFATGIDTGCVYGNALTGLVLDADEPMPTSEAERRARLVSIRARHAWFPVE